MRHALPIALVIFALGSLSMIRAVAEPGPAPPAKGRVFEMRTYTPFPGRAEAMHARFRDHTCALFKKHGMELVGFWTPQDDKDKGKLVYILAYPSREDAKAMWKAFQDDPEWKKVYADSHKDGKIVDKVESVFLDPTDYSPVK